MYQHDPFLAHCVREALQIRGTLVMPPCSDGLQNESALLEILRMGALPKLVRSKAVPVCGEGLDDMLEGVWRGEPCGGIEVLLYICNLIVE